MSRPFCTRKYIQGWDRTSENATRRSKLVLRRQPRLPRLHFDRIVRVGGRSPLCENLWPSSRVREQLKIFKVLLPDSLGQNLALIVLYVPYSPWRSRGPSRRKTCLPRSLSSQDLTVLYGTHKTVIRLDCLIWHNSDGSDHRYHERRKRYDVRLQGMDIHGVH